MQRDFKTLLELVTAIPDEDAAIEHFMAVRWRNGAFCPYCSEREIYHFADKRNHRCATCKARFSIKVGTVMEGTKVGVRQWLMAIWLITAHKKGIASTQLARDIGVTQKTAWFMLHRLRHGARTHSFNAPLKGFVEADETFIGGKETNKPLSKRKPKQHGGKGKAMVFGVLERDGELRTFHTQDKIGSVREIVKANVAEGSNLLTDQHPVYKSLEGHFHHYTVDHSKNEYVRDGFIHTNGIEGAWSLLKRQIIGIHHFVSAKHLSKYLTEMTWRYNRREWEDADRLNQYIHGMNGRLTYKALIA